MANAVNITSLQRAAEKYQRDFKILPWASLMPTIQKLRLRTLEVANEDVIVEKQRKGGLTKPYNAATGGSATEQEISKLQEKRLKVEPGYLAMKDHIMNYKEKNVLWDPTKNKINNKTKKHPLEKEIIGDVVKTASEDIIDAFFPAERNTDDASPQGLFDGFDTKIDEGIAAGEIAAGKGNYVASDAMDTPSNSDDTSAWDNLVAWVRSRHNRFARNAVLRIPLGTYRNCRDALKNKLKYKDVLFEDFQAMLRDEADFESLVVIRSYEMGTGDRLHLSQDGLFEFGMNSMSDMQFVQVWADNDDPNIAKFWLQFMAGSRIVSWHEKVFMVNDGTPVANELSGDYS